MATIIFTPKYKPRKTMSKIYNEQENIDRYDELENGWWWYSILRNPPTSRGRQSEPVKFRYGNVYLKSIAPLLCDKCGYTWTPVINKFKNIKASIIHEGFPKYKLRKKTCEFCKLRLKDD